MKIVKSFPPNYQEIYLVLRPPASAVFAYGDEIYNPSGQVIPADIMRHEEVHGRQMRRWPAPEIWWKKYLLDKDFRKDQEAEAFSEQVRWVKENINSRAGKECLEECASNLATNYYLGLTTKQAETLIRKWE
jgi:hypothetical protein